MEIKVSLQETLQIQDDKKDNAKKKADDDAKQVQAWRAAAPKELIKVADWIRDGKVKRILALTGAGLSVAAGIPDFRTKGTGLYDNLSKYNLPFPEAVFELNFYKQNPQPFTTLAKELWPGNFLPTLAHSFLTLLHRKGLLLRCYTQNIDGLEHVGELCVKNCQRQSMKLQQVLQSTFEADSVLDAINKIATVADSVLTHSCIDACYIDACHFFFLLYNFSQPNYPRTPWWNVTDISVLHLVPNAAVRPTVKPSRTALSRTANPIIARTAKQAWSSPILSFLAKACRDAFIN